MTTHESEDELSLPGWNRKRRVLRLSSDISQPDPMQTAAVGEDLLDMTPTSDNSSDENCFGGGKKKGEVLRSGRTTRLSFKKRQEVAARVHCYDRSKRRRRRREKQSPETETDTSQDPDVRRPGVIPEAVLLSVPEVDMCSIEDELEAVKKSQSQGAQKCSPGKGGSPAQSHKHGRGPLGGSKTSPGRSSAVRTNAEEVPCAEVQKQPSPMVECKNLVEKEGEGNTGERGHLVNLESWQHDLKPTSTKAPVLFALDHLQDTLNLNNVKWMTKARRIWTAWKKQPQEVRKEYVEKAKQNRGKMRLEQGHFVKHQHRQINTGRVTSSNGVRKPSISGKDVFTSSEGSKSHTSARPKQTKFRLSLDMTRKEPLMVVGTSAALYAEEIPIDSDRGSKVGPSFITMARSELMQPLEEPSQLVKISLREPVVSQSNALTTSGSSVTWSNWLQSGHPPIRSATGSTLPVASGTVAPRANRPTMLPLTNGCMATWTNTSNGSLLSPLLSNASGGPSHTSNKTANSGLDYTYSATRSCLPSFSRVNESIAASRPVEVVAHSQSMVACSQSTAPSRPSTGFHNGLLVASGPMPLVGASGSLVVGHAQTAGEIAHDTAGHTIQLLPNAADFATSQPSHGPAHQMLPSSCFGQSQLQASVDMVSTSSAIPSDVSSRMRSLENASRTLQPLLSYSDSSVPGSTEGRSFHSYSISALGLSNLTSAPTLAQATVPLFAQPSFHPTGHTSTGRTPSCSSSSSRVSQPDQNIKSTCNGTTSSSPVQWSTMSLTNSTAMQVSPTAAVQASQPHQPAPASGPASSHVTSPTMVSFLHPSVVDQTAAKQLDPTKLRRRRMSKTKPRPSSVSLGSHNSLPASPLSTSFSPLPSLSPGAERLARVSEEWKEMLRREIHGLAKRVPSSKSDLPATSTNKPKSTLQKRAGSGSSNQPPSRKKSLSSPMQTGSPTFLGSMGISKMMVAKDPFELGSPKHFPPITRNESDPALMPWTPLSSISAEHNPPDSSDQSLDNDTGASSPLSPTSHMLSTSDACNYAALERHYWQAELMLERQKQYVSSLKRRRQQAQLVQQVMLLQSDRYKTFRNMIIQPQWDIEVPIQFPGLRKDLPALEIEGTLDHPIMKGKDIYKKLVQSCHP